ncbi:MAG: hypothetical protein JWR80_6528 [Bradyrhizobium sp.]|nr:hypothetical protein [Bradyrhizobium sp.]
MAADAPAWVKESLERRGRLAKESVERKAKRLQPVKKPWTWEQKERAALWRAYRAEQRLTVAYAICEAWWQRPEPPDWRIREKWTGEEQSEFEQRLAEFDATHDEPSAKQRRMVRDYLDCYERERLGIEKPPPKVYEPGTEPWGMAKSYRKLRAKFGFTASAGLAAGGNLKYLIANRFEELYLRSKLSYSLQRFAPATPKGGRKRRYEDDTFMQPLMGGPAKDDRLEYWAKLEALDQPYITLCSVMRSGWRIEIDRDFASFAELRAHLEKKVRRGKLACLPHVVVGHVDAATGVLKHPHLWWWLPEDCKVLYDRNNPNASRKVMRRYDGVVNGITKELEDIGADAGGLGNPIDGKNPLSPQWSAQVWNDNTFPTLHQWAKHVNCFIPRDHIVREQCIRASELSPEMSITIFTGSSAMAWALMHAAYKSGDEAFRLLIDDGRALADWLLERLRPAFKVVGESRKTERRTDRVLRSVAKFVGAAWSPERLERKPKKRKESRRGFAFTWLRGIELREDDGRLVPEAKRLRKSVGAKIGNAGKKQKTITALVAAMTVLRDLGLAITPQAVTDRVDVVSRTVDRNWDIALAAFNDGEIPDIRCLIGGDVELREYIDLPSDLPDLQKPNAQSSERVVDLWPGGFDDHGVTKGSTTRPAPGAGQTAAVDPCWSATEDSRHEPVAEPSISTFATPAPPSPDTGTGEGETVTARRDGERLQRGLPAEAVGGWETGSPGDRRSIHAGGSGEPDDPCPSCWDGRSGEGQKGFREGACGADSGDTAIAGRCGAQADLQQQWNRNPHQKDMRRDGARRATYAERRDLTLANDGTTHSSRSFRSQVPTDRRRRMAGQIADRRR